MVFLYLANSKTDVEAEGTLRVLHSVELLEKAKACTPPRARRGFATCPRSLSDGQKASKAQTVRSWKDGLDTKITGHSARRSGALFYIRSSYALEQVKFLGRWKSDVVMEYAAEALEERPALGCGGKGHGKRKAGLDALDHSAVLERHTQLFKEMKEASEEFKAKLQDNFRKYVEVMETKGERSSEAHNPDQAPLYRKVCSTYSGLVHDIDLSLVKETPHLWKTKCGWPYGFSNFTYVTNVDEPTSCKKCRALRKVVMCTAANEMSDGKAKPEMPTRTLHEMLHQPA